MGEVVETRGKGEDRCEPSSDETAIPGSESAGETGDEVVTGDGSD